MTVSDIFSFLNEKFPLDTACDFDNPGILAGDSKQDVTKALIALDCTEKVLKTATDQGCQLIITHHPIIFTPLKNVCENSIVYKLIKNNISVISMHTNLDIGIGGVNDCLCNAIGLNNVKKVTAGDGFLLNKGELPYTLSDDDLAKYLKEKLGGGVKYLSLGRKINRVLLCSGSGGSYLGEVLKNNCQAIITADVKHNVFVDAEALGIPVFDAGHFETENVVINPLKELLENKFEDIKFITHLTTKIKTV